ncbi:MAG: 2-oxo-4-hydroxy-4-carboxy-5-ureidoimidazoline decarboxylase [Deltaproteobacteria bacterium]|nr:2-oxo-4-hydroxy-4-carboxy-5-ureidoimidazoline decarboxylase [Deltaproteobacteria bacterium]
MTSFNLVQFNSLSPKEATQVLAHCCGAARWVSQMESSRPFQNRKALFNKAIQTWNQLTEKDWKEAFTHHPKIGDLESLKKKFASTRVWAEQEQKGSAEAAVSVLQALALGNQTYENRFGYIFIVCATGKKADEMLALLEARLNNSPDIEIKIAAGEQAKITQIRLEKLIHE